MRLTIAAATILAAITVQAYRVVQFPADVEAFSLGADQGKLTAVEVFSPSNGTVSLKRIWTESVFTNYLQIATSSGTEWTVICTNLTGAATTNVMGYPGWQPLPGWIVASRTSATRTTATTNQASAWAYDVAVTNTLVSGSVQTNVFSGVPAADTYLAPGESLLSDGTANTGFIRLILE